MRELADFDITGTCHSQQDEALEPLSLADRGQVCKLVENGGFTHIIHCAALRSPDYCIEHPLKAYTVNALGVEYLAAAAGNADAHLCYISTDYVFSGTKPPYREDDIPDPINLYGRTKLAGEHAARSTRKHLILRIPALWRTDMLDQRNFATTLAGWLAKSEELLMDSETVRYYTLADEVAGAIRFCLENNSTGTLHLSAEQKTSKADFARKVAAALGMGLELIKDAPPPATGDLRPYDSHLCTDAWKALGGPAFTSIDKALANFSS